MATHATDLYRNRVFQNFKHIVHGLSYKVWNWEVFKNSVTNATTLATIIFIFHTLKDVDRAVHKLTDGIIWKTRK